MISKRRSRIMPWPKICVGALLALTNSAPVAAEEGFIQEVEELYQQVIQLSNQGQYSEAIPSAARALAITEQAQGPLHPDTATSLNNLAGLYSDTGAYDKAGPLYERALAIREQVLGATHPDTATSLNNLALHFSDTGAYDKARPLYERALAIMEQALGPLHSDTATSLNNLAGLYADTGAYDKAGPLFERALAIREQVQGAMHPDTATSLNNLAGLYSDMGVYEKAAALYQRALAITEQALGLSHPDTATSLDNLAGLYADMGAYNKAKPLYEQALTIREQVLGSMHPDTATSLNNLAGLYSDMGVYEKAAALYQEALAITEQVLGPSHPDTATSLNNLAGLYAETGAYGKARTLHQRALALRQQVLGPMHIDTATSLNNLAGIYSDTGAYAKAEPLYQRALIIIEKALGSLHPDLASSLNNLALHFSDTGAYDKAEPLYQRALSIREQVLGPMHPDTSTSLNNLAALYDTTGAYAKAVPLYQRALGIYEKALGPIHPVTALSLNNLAGVYSATGASDKAEALYQRALTIQEQALGLSHPDTALLLNNLAALYDITRDYTKAKPLYQRALAIREQALGPTHLDTATSLKNLAIMHWAAGNPALALPLIERTQVIQEKNTTEFLLSGSEARKQAYLQQVHGTTFVDISLSLTESDSVAALGLTSVLQTKGRILDAMSDSVTRLRESMRPDDRKLFGQFTDMVRQQSTLRYQGPGKLPADVYRARQSELAARQEHLETELATRSAEFRQEQAPITLAAIQAALPGGAVLLEWFRYQPFDPKAKDEQARWGKPRYVAYVLTRSASPTVVDLGRADSIELLVKDFRKALSDPQSMFVKEVAQELFAKLIEPLQPYLGNAKQFLISPDGALNLVPFGALLDEADHYLGTKWDITYLTSGRDLLRFSTTPVANGDAVVVANPDYGPLGTSVIQAETTHQSARSADLDRGGLVFKPLGGTTEEARALTHLLKVKDEHLLTQAKATEAKLKQLHGPRILHIATHGFFLNDKEMSAAMPKAVGFSQDLPPLLLGENPLLRSGLALAGANIRRSGTNDDGILTALEVAQMDLRGTKLVVLSACETGVGDVQNGEGVYGLRRSLVLAGAQTQVASLWKVSDDATKDLMVDYYERLLKGEGRSAALRKAQRTMINSNDRSHPYYWAAFVPVGNWKPLAETR